MKEQDHQGTELDSSNDNSIIPFTGQHTLTIPAAEEVEEVIQPITRGRANTMAGTPDPDQQANLDDVIEQPITRGRANTIIESSLTTSDLSPTTINELSNSQPTDNPTTPKKVTFKGATQAVIAANRLEGSSSSSSDEQHVNLPDVLTPQPLRTALVTNQNEDSNNLTTTFEEIAEEGSTTIIMTQTTRIYDSSGTITPPTNSPETSGPNTPASILNNYDAIRATTPPATSPAASAPNTPQHNVVIEYLASTWANIIVTLNGRANHNNQRRDDADTEDKVGVDPQIGMSLLDNQEEDNAPHNHDDAQPADNHPHILPRNEEPQAQPAVNNPNILQRALVFAGALFEAAHDLWEAIYGEALAEDNNIVNDQIQNAGGLPDPQALHQQALGQLNPSASFSNEFTSNS